MKSTIENNQNLEEIPCPLCGEKKSRLLTTKGKFGLPTNVSICENDGFVYLTPRWTQERYLRFYAEEYDNYHRPRIFSEETEERKFGSIRNIISRVEKHNVKMDSILDLASGMGWSLHYIKTNVNPDAELAAIESSRHCVQHLKEVIQVDVIAKDVDSNWEENNQGRFDFIIMRHVLEHFMNPIESLKKVAKALNKEGKAYIAVPDMMRPQGSFANHWFRAAHTFYFSEATLVYAASQAGLHCEIIKPESNDAEIWGVFSKKADISLQLPSLFEKQLEVIQNHPET